MNAIQNDSEVEPLTLDERRRAALAEIDDAKFSSFHLKVCLVAGLGLFTDAYDIFIISIAKTMIGYVYGDEVVHCIYRDAGRKLSPGRDYGIKAATLGGAMFGQLVFGWLADRVGRKRMYGIELIVMTLTTFAQALAGGGTTYTIDIVSVLILWRILMGIGIGGDYPMSAIIVSEFSPIHVRGRLMTIVIIFQGLGTFVAALVSLAVVSGFGNNNRLQVGDNLNLNHVDLMWRLLIGFGCVPAAIGLYFRLTVSETPRFTIDIERNLDQGLADIDISLSREDINFDAEIIRRVAVPKASVSDFTRYFSQWENLRVLLGAAYSWFAIDTVFYGLDLNASTLLGTNGTNNDLTDGQGWTDTMVNPFNVTAPLACHGVCVKLFQDSATSLIVATVSSVPGYFVSFAFADSWGRKPIQIMGFSALAIIFFTMGGTFEKLNSSGPIGNKIITFLYCLTNFFQNFGPNMSTFVIPGELFPTRYRSTCYGIAAAGGKLGATISLAVFSVIIPNASNMGHTLIVFGVIMLTGIGSTLWLPEPNGKSLEDLSNERQEGFVQGYGKAKKHL